VLVGSSGIQVDGETILDWESPTPAPAHVYEPLRVAVEVADSAAGETTMDFVTDPDLPARILIEAMYSSVRGGGDHLRLVVATDDGLSRRPLGGSAHWVRPGASRESLARGNAIYEASALRLDGEGVHLRPTESRGPPRDWAWDELDGLWEWAGSLGVPLTPLHVWVGEAVTVQRLLDVLDHLRSPECLEFHWDEPHEGCFVLHPSLGLDPPIPRPGDWENLELFALVQAHPDGPGKGTLSEAALLERFEAATDGLEECLRNDERSRT
jgi:hypothetical protein